MEVDVEESLNLSENTEGGRSLEGTSSLAGSVFCYHGFHLLKPLYSCDIIIMQPLEPAFSVG